MSQKVERIYIQRRQSKSPIVSNINITKKTNDGTLQLKQKNEQYLPVLNNE